MKQYYLIDRNGIYTRHGTSHGTRTVWDRACDVAVSYVNQKGLESGEFEKRRKAGEIKIVEIELSE